MFQFRQQEHDGRISVHVDNALASAQGCVADVFVFIRQGLEDGRNDLADIRREFCLENHWKVDEHGDVSIFNVGSYIESLGRGNDFRHEFVQLVDSQSTHHF